MACEFKEDPLSKQLCGIENSGFCTTCGIAICERHGMATSEGLMCINCIAKSKYDDASVSRIIEYPENEDSFWDQLS